MKMKLDEIETKADFYNYLQKSAKSHRRCQYDEIDITTSYQTWLIDDVVYLIQFSGEYVFIYKMYNDLSKI